jgi:hypothetical protein
MFVPQQIPFCFYAHSHTVYILVVQQAHGFAAIGAEENVPNLLSLFDNRMKV